MNPSHMQAGVLFFGEYRRNHDAVDGGARDCNL